MYVHDLAEGSPPVKRQAIAVETAQKWEDHGRFLILMKRN